MRELPQCLICGRLITKEMSRRLAILDFMRTELDDVPGKLACWFCADCCEKVYERAKGLCCDPA